MGTVHAKQQDDRGPFKPFDMENSKHAQAQSRPKSVNLQGLKARVDKVSVDGLGRTKDDIVKDSIKDLFDAGTFEEVIIKSHRVRSQLDSLGCFQNVGVFIDVSSGPEATPDGLEVTFRVNELSRIVGGVNTSVGNNEGSLVLGVKLPNTHGRGERLQCEYSMGHLKTSNFSVMWSKPFPGRQLTPTLSASLFQQNSEYPWSGYHLLDKGILLDLGFKTSNYVKHNLQWEGLLRNTSVMANRSKDASFTVREDCGPSLKSMVRHIVAMDRRDDIIFPTRGTLTQFTTEICGLGGGVAYLKNDLLLQVNKEIVNECVLQGSVQSGVLYNVHDTKLTDHFFLGGPMSIRGFKQRGAGPQREGSSVGGTLYWASGLHLFTPLPFKPGEGGLGDLFRTHFFVNAGNLVHADQDNLGDSVRDIFQNIRLSTGLGLAVRIAGIARLELNYCFLLKTCAQDCTVSGVQFGIGVNFL